MDYNDLSRWKRLSFALQHIWRLAIPFWKFRDAGRGTIEQRLANYRYNRSQRKILPFYMWKWIGIAACMFQLMRVLSGLMARTATESTDHLCAAFFCMSAGIGFAFSCVVLSLLLGSYLFLSWVKK